MNDVRDAPEESVDSSSTSERPHGPLGFGDAAGVLHPGSVLVGRFTLLEELGSGGIGRVFSARDRELGGRVALKVLRPELADPASLERLRREVRAARSPHPALVKVFDVHRHGELHFLSMELVDGTSLRDRLRRDGPAGVEAVVEIGRQVASALAHLHGLGVVHRDVKPGNVLLAASGEVKLCDLGLARPLASGATVTATELVVGTPAYMAPEQASGGSLTPATDVYALGLTLVETLSGKVPLVDSSPLATLDRRRRERLPPLRRDLPECPPWLDRLLRAMLEPRPADRPSAAAVVRALEHRRMAPTLTRRLRRRVMAVVAAAAATVVAGTVVHELLIDRPVRLDVGAGEVRGLDRDGDVVWRRTVVGRILSSALGDLDGDGVDELAVATEPAMDNMRRSGERPPSQVAAFALDGRVVTSVRVEERLVSWDLSFPRQVGPMVSALDLDGDGPAELVVVANQVGFFPSAVLVYWPAQDAWQQVLYHAGHVTAVAAAPADGRARLRFAAVNNRLGFVTVLAEMELDRPDRARSEVPTVVLGSPEGGAQPETTQSRWRFYTPLAAECGGPRTSPSSLRVLPDGGTAAVDRCGERRIDPLGNPVPGPTAGLDLGVARFELLARAAAEYRMSWQPDRAAVDLGFRELGEGAGRLLEEPGTRLAFELFRARSLARVGDLDRAIAGLEELCAAVPSEDAVYRLAHLEAIAGRYSAAIGRLEPMSGRPATPRGEYDATHLLIRLAAATRDRELASVVIPRLALSYADRDVSSGLSGALWARVQLWWDEPTAADEQVRAWGFEPAGDAIAVLARWRRGRSRPGDLELLRTSLATNPDARDEIRLATAAARIAAGDAELAAAELQALAQELEPQATDDFYAAQCRNLARALRTVALAVSGERERARREAAELQARLTPNLLPANLVGEVVQGEW